MPNVFSGSWQGLARRTRVFGWLLGTSCEAKDFVQVVLARVGKGEVDGPMIMEAPIVSAWDRLENQRVEAFRTACLEQEMDLEEPQN